MDIPAPAEAWPSLPLEAWSETYTTLHMWTQIVGKVCLARAPMVNHWWQVPLYVTARGLSTSPIPHGRRVFQIKFDFLDHRLLIQTAGGGVRHLTLGSRSVAEFYREIMTALHDLGVPVKIWPRPVEVEESIPFEEDVRHCTYDPEQAQQFWRVLVQVDRVMKQFRSRFIGKCSPVHFFWGSFDMAVTRFSGRRRRPIRAGCPIWPTGLCGRPTRTSAAVAGSGRAAARCKLRPSMPTPTRSPTVSRVFPSGHSKRFTALICGSSFCFTRTFGRPAGPKRCCLSFSRVRTRPPRSWVDGTGRPLRWSTLRWKSRRTSSEPRPFRSPRRTTKGLIRNTFRSTGFQPVPGFTELEFARMVGSFLFLIPKTRARCPCYKQPLMIRPMRKGLPSWMA